MILGRRRRQAAREQAAASLRVFRARYEGRCCCGEPIRRGQEMAVVRDRRGPRRPTHADCGRRRICAGVATLD